MDPDALSGTPFWISKGLLNNNIHLKNHHIIPPQRLLPIHEELAFRCKQLWLRFIKKNHLCPDILRRRALHVADQVHSSLIHLKTDVILTSHTPIAGAYIETKTPMVYWTDAVYAGIANFYPRFRSFHSDTHWDGHLITKACLYNAKHLIFSSDWAARTAVEFYGVSRKKISVIPFGANIETSYSLADIKKIIDARPKHSINLLFVGKEWYRKGGDFALEVTKTLNNAGHPATLTIVGCKPPIKNMPEYVTYHEFLSKKKSNDIEKLKHLFEMSHFLLLPTNADACPIVLAEANAFATPCITSYVGGIPTVITNDINGQSFSLEAHVNDYCDYIINLMHNNNEYKNLCLSSFNEYITRLNWNTSAAKVKKLLLDII